MDTSSYLRSQGWLGTGHALNSHKPGLGLEAGQRTPGLSKPLTIPQKQNVFGVGKKQHDSHADQWWARAFDDVLKGVNAGPEGPKTPGVGVGQQQPRTNMISMRMGGLGKHENLYGNFVRGEGLRGTFLKAEDEEEEDVGMMAGRRDGLATGRLVDKGTKRKREHQTDEDVLPAVKNICKEESAPTGNREAAQLHASKLAVQESSISMTVESAAGNSREQRRLQRRQQEARKAKELADVQNALSMPVKEPIEVNGELKETKEERRRRRKERGDTEAAEAAGAQTALKSTGEEPVSLVLEGTDTKAQRNQRREERRAAKAAQTAKPQIALKSPVEEPVSRNDQGSETKEERRQRREERRARKATEKPKVAVHQAAVSTIPLEVLENGKAIKVAPDDRAKKELAMTDEPSTPSTFALKRENNARDEKKKKKKKKREQKTSI